MRIKSLINYLDKGDFFHSVFSLQRWLLREVKVGEVGTDALPAKERIRFKVAQHLGFPATAIESIKEEVDEAGITQAECYVNFTGLTGPSGIMPRHYTELLIERTKLKDTALRDFFDLFNHRLISFHYRAWEKNQFAVQYERQLLGREPEIDPVLRGLTGAKQDLDVYLGGLFTQQVRNTQGLRQILELLSGNQIEIREFVGRWVALQKNEQTCLGSRIQPEGQHAQLGVSTFVGERVWDVTSAIDIEIKGGNSSQCAELMKEGRLLKILKRVVSHYVPTSVDVKWYLTTTYRNLPVADLSQAGPGLGRGATLMIRGCFMDKELSIPVN